MSERLKNIDDCYQQVKTAIDNKLKAGDYTIRDEGYSPQAFGNRYTTWSNEINDIRLIWDGKDGWFYLEVAHRSKLNWKVEWNTLIHVAYLKEHDLSYASSIPVRLLASLDGIAK